MISCSKTEEIPDFTLSNTGPYLLNVQHLEFIKDNLDKTEFHDEYSKLIAGAESILLIGSFDYVGNKEELPPSGDKNDYMSLARYSGMGDGITNPLIFNYDRPKLAIISSAIYTLSLAYFFDGNEQYAEKASELIHGWFLDEETKMNPNMNYAQINPDTERVKGEYQGIIDANDFIRIIEAISLIYYSQSWSTNSHISLKNWFYDFSVWIINNYNTDAFETLNISTWMDAQRIIYFLFTEREDKINSNSHVAPITERIETQIQPNGHMTFELTRQRQRHYEYFNLKAYLTIALLRKNRTGNDRDWSNSNPANFSRLQPLLQTLILDIDSDFNARKLIDNEVFDKCRYLEIFRMAELIFKSEEYGDTANSLRNSGCSDPDASLVFPPLELLNRDANP